MTAAAAVALALFAVLDWMAVYRRWARVEWVAKPLVIVALAWLAFTMGAADQDVGRFLFAALAFCLVGDLFLLADSAFNFAGGLLSFLVAHIVYAVAFFSLGFEPWWALAGVLIVLSLSLTSGRRIIRGAARDGGGALGAGVTTYLVVISLMVVTASGTARPLVFLGALFFLLSDTVLALDRFVGQRAHARMLVIVTYHLGQVLMVVGALR